MDVAVEWNDDNLKTLRQLWAEGWSCSQISSRIPNSTRSAIIGKIHRLGLSGRITTRRTPHPPRARKPRKLPKPGARGLFPWPSIFGRAPKFSQLPLPKPNAADVGRKTLLELDDHDCRYPVGDDATQMFCAERKIEGLSYCLTHALRCHQPPQPRKREPAKPGGQLIRIAGGMNFEDAT